MVRRSRQGGWLVFVFNLERAKARITLPPRWQTAATRDLLTQTELKVEDNAFRLEVEPWEVALIHCAQG